MQLHTVFKIVIIFLVHIMWCVLVFVNQVFFIHKNKYIETSYHLNILFSSAEGIKKGTLIHYKGVNVGEVLSINLYTDYILVSACIQSSNVSIPLNAYIKTHKSIFMSDTTLHIYSQESKSSGLSRSFKQATFEARCQNNDFIYGFQGASFNNLIDILVSLSIQLDNTDIVNLLYNLVQSFDEILEVIYQNLL